MNVSDPGSVRTATGTVVCMNSTSAPLTKKLVAASAAAVLSLGVAACSDDDGDDDDIDNPVDGVDDQIDDGAEEIDEEIDSETDD